MGRLIDAEKLKTHYSWWKDGTREMTMGEAKDIFDDIVDLQPTVTPDKEFIPLGKERRKMMITHEEDIFLQSFKVTSCKYIERKDGRLWIVNGPYARMELWPTMFSFIKDGEGITVEELLRLEVEE